MSRILCFGDSLTEGYTFQEGSTFQKSGYFHPYSTELHKLLAEHCQETVVVHSAGVSGEKVVPSMSERLDKLLKEASQPYDWVIILGGTNDLGTGALGTGCRAEDLLPHLLALHDRAKETGSRTLALAIPQYINELNPGNEKFRSEKAKVNDGLKVYSEQADCKTYFVDLWNDLPFGALSAEERVLYWVDDAHMTPRGYDKMAHVIFDCLRQHI